MQRCAYSSCFTGYSRIPIYQGEKSNVIRILYVRDLALIDPEDRTPLTLFTKLMSDQEIVYIDEGTTIDAVFNIFKDGNANTRVHYQENSHEYH